MTSMPAAAQARLDAVLNAPVVGRTRHEQTSDLARRYVRPDVIVKAAVAEVAEARNARRSGKR